MKSELIPFKSKAWGVVTRPNDHFFTGYIKAWDDGRKWGGPTPEDQMQIGTNVIITGDFRIEGMSRGRSAAGFSGTFRDHPKVSYDFGMQGTMQLWSLIQSETFPIVDGYIRGKWTLAKQGQSVFLCPFIA